MMKSLRPKRFFVAAALLSGVSSLFSAGADDTGKDGYRDERRVPVVIVTEQEQSEVGKDGILGELCREMRHKSHVSVSNGR